MRRRGGFSFVYPPADRSYADPFLVSEADKLYLFVENFPIKPPVKGVLEVLEIGSDGAMSEPRVVLEREYHLSYPFVFRDGDSWWMMPESSANNSLGALSSDSIS